MRLLRRRCPCGTAGDANMRFYNVQDLRANGLFIERYRGPGLEVGLLGVLLLQ